MLTKCANANTLRTLLSRMASSSSSSTTVYPEPRRRKWRQFRQTMPIDWIATKRRRPDAPNFGQWKIDSEFLHGFDDNLNHEVVGVSDKTHPVFLKWQRPKRILKDEFGASGSGDMETFPERDDFDLQRPRRPYRGVEDAIANAPEEVRKVFSVEFGRNSDLLEEYKTRLKAKVRRHRLDEDSLEVAIAEITATIRLRRRILDEAAEPETLYNKVKGYVQQHPMKNMRNGLRKLIYLRGRMLQRLRRTDIKKFEWVLEQLNLIFKEKPDVWQLIDRKTHLTRLTDLWCDELKQFRLDEYKLKLQDRQPKFLREKAETLRWIMKEEAELGLEATVTERDVQECLEKAEAIEAELEKPDTSKKYHIYKPDKIEEYHKFIT